MTSKFSKLLNLGVIVCMCLQSIVVSSLLATRSPAPINLRFWHMNEDRTWQRTQELQNFTNHLLNIFIYDRKHISTTLMKRRAVRPEVCLNYLPSWTNLPRSTTHYLPPSTPSLQKTDFYANRMKNFSQ